jgi:hypothetical protein
LSRGGCHDNENGDGEEDAEDEDEDEEEDFETRFQRLEWERRQAVGVALQQQASPVAHLASAVGGVLRHLASAVVVFEEEEGNSSSSSNNNNSSRRGGIHHRVGTEDDDGDEDVHNNDDDDDDDINPFSSPLPSSGKGEHSKRGPGSSGRFGRWGARWRQRKGAAGEDFIKGHPESSSEGGAERLIAPHLVAAVTLAGEGPG